MAKKEIIFGVQPILEALRSHQDIDKILWQNNRQSDEKLAEISRLAKQQEIPIMRTPLAKLNRMTGKNHQGIIALVSSVHFMPLENIIPTIFEQGEAPLILVLDRVTDVRNFGAISRTAECAGVHAIVIPARGSARINEDAMKTSSGALNFIPVCREANLAQSLEYLKHSGLQIIGASEKAKKALYEIDFTLPTAIVMGSEEDGLSAEVAGFIDSEVAIPIKGNVASLNVSVSAGVMIYEAIRQRL